MTRPRKALTPAAHRGFFMPVRQGCPVSTATETVIKVSLRIDIAYTVLARHPSILKVLKHKAMNNEQAIAKQRKHIAELHPEVIEWINYCLFVKDEIKSLNIRLGEILHKYTDHGVQAQVEHFQNQFIRQDEASDELLHDLRAAEHIFSDISQNNPAANHVLFDDHVELRDKAETHKQIFEELRHEFQLFLARYM